MTNILYEPGVPALTMEGHAGAAEKGRDLVCAALSALSCVLEAGGGESARGPGRFRCRGGDAAVCRAVAAVLARLAVEYPDFVRIEVKA